MKMFQKIQELIDDKDALVCVLVDEVQLIVHLWNKYSGTFSQWPPRGLTSVGMQALEGGGRGVGYTGYLEEEMTLLHIVYQLIFKSLHWLHVYNKIWLFFLL